MLQITRKPGAASHLRRCHAVLLRPLAATLCTLLCSAVLSAEATDHPGASLSTRSAGEAAALDSSKSVARNWNNALLFAIRHDLARPTVHARNLFHSAAAMYDAWAVFDTEAELYFLGSRRAMQAANNDADPDTHAALCEFSIADRLALNSGLDAQQTHTARQRAISHASFRLFNHRFSDSPGAVVTLQRFADLFAALGNDAANQDLDLSGTTPYAALGNRIAACVIAATLHDGANEADNYSNRDYQPVNTPLSPIFPGTPGLIDPNRWQPLQLDNFIDQSGNETDVPVFLGAEWGRVIPFALSSEDLTLYTRDGVQYPVYHDPGLPALLSAANPAQDHYQWGHTLVALWSSHLDPADGVMWDISPASLGNPPALPDDLADLKTFYDRLQGGTGDQGYQSNPVTGQPYTPQWVPRGDYTRVVAEFWADGPDSETPPGHWFQILNTNVIDHPLFSKRWEGTGAVLDDLRFDIQAYFALGAAMHDSAIAAWGIKGWYDYIRPISALRYLSSLGQSTDLSQTNYHLQGIALEPGLIESVEAGDVLAGNGGQNIGRIKIRAWRGPGFIADPDSDIAGVGWILLDNWWPYQRPTFVTPPFAGYVSGHSTFSRAAAEVLTRVTGDAFFPGGMGEFVAGKDRFLVFEDGPSVDVRLQWATYRDASDQTSLSRIWGGIHPPVDDIPGRLIGIEVGNNAYDKAVQFFAGTVEDDLPVDDPFVSTGSGALQALLPLLLALLLPRLLQRRPSPTCESRFPG